jgi:hypothetical protein
MTRDPGELDPQTQQFMRAVLAPERPIDGHRELGTTPLARQLGLAEEQMGGHWCSRCEGIWYGCPLEVECPCCGNRHG